MRLVVLGCAITMVAVWMLLFRRLPPGIRAAISLPVGWAVHVIIFTSAAWLRLFPSLSLNVWSNAVRAHGLGAWIIGGLYLLSEVRRA